MHTHNADHAGDRLVLATPAPERDALRRAISDRYLCDETECVESLLEDYAPSQAARTRIEHRATQLVHAVRANRVSTGGLDAFLHQYDLSSQEGVVLMCLAEALLRVPDSTTADRLIRDKLRSGDWKGHLGGSQSLFVNASTWGLMLTGRVIGPTQDAVKDPTGFVSRMVTKAGEPVVRGAMRQAMRIMGHQFVMGRTIDDAIKRSHDKDNASYRYSFDMLGEAALTDIDASAYFDAYSGAIEAIGKDAAGAGSIFRAPGISVKLSALHPRYELAQRERVMHELVPRLGALARQARDAGIGFCVDAEEADRLDISLDVIEAVYASQDCHGWEGFGLAVQAYQKRGRAVVEWLIELARKGGRKIPLRLVKGAYWDTEVKHSQEEGQAGYPVFTRKMTTDLSYLCCAQRLLGARDYVYPQFATHNAHTVASILEMAGTTRGFEFQRLHGMGEELYAEIAGEEGQKKRHPCRVYAPVGQHEDLLPYLVRRLLENGANTSFVNRIVDEAAPVSEIVADPVAALAAADVKPHPHIPLPRHVYGAERENSLGRNLADLSVLSDLKDAFARELARNWQAPVMSAGEDDDSPSLAVTDPALCERIIGHAAAATTEQVNRAVALAAKAQPDWDRRGGTLRGDVLLRAADLFEDNANALLVLCIREAGKVIGDAEAELREAIDFLRYYGLQARHEFSDAVALPGPTGETNQIYLSGRGVFVCISPWNFPLAIFVGQVAAALAAGNAVVAKPAEQTPLVAAQAVRLLYEAGVPDDVLHFVPGDGVSVGAAAVAHPAVAGVAFTGSTETARIINRSLAGKDGPIATLIAETGGQNAMVVDSSALPEQVVKDVVRSSFNSAGQRCSALRVLFLQNEIAPRVIELLTGAMRELVIGDPGLIRTDVGPVIDQDALKILQMHAARLRADGNVIAECELPDECAGGTFFAPVLAEIASIDYLEREIFGPVLHIVRYSARDIDGVIDSINATGYGLTMGIHSRIDSSARYIRRRVRVGNAYVNRNMVGAVVGVQPFGGCGLSGTGPKAGGPRYLHRFATEQTVSTNTAAVGGNTTLLSLSSEN